LRSQADSLLVWIAGTLSEVFMTRRTIFQIYIGLFGIGCLFWWVLSHWLYPDWYHNLLGFHALSAPEYAMAKTIGTLTAMPVMGMFFVARNPERNRDLFLGLLVLSLLMIGTYLYLMAVGDFPTGEMLNVVLIAVNMAILSGLYPWRDNL
jgi:hypothetical protein